MKEINDLYIALSMAAAILALLLAWFNEKKGPKLVLASVGIVLIVFSFRSCGGFSVTGSTDDYTNTPDIGDIIKLGNYEQDNNFDNGSEPIEWLVIDRRESAVMLISLYALDCIQYNTEPTSVTWATSSIRGWLNDDFYTEAFNNDERKLIQETTISADNNPKFNTYPGPDTIDKVFLLSQKEVVSYINDNERLCIPTEFAIAEGAYRKPANGCCWWWLRTPGETSYDAASVNSDRSIDYDGGSVDSDKGAVRPAMWVNYD